MLAGSHPAVELIWGSSICKPSAFLGLGELCLESLGSKCVGHVAHLSALSNLKQTLLIRTASFAGLTKAGIGLGKSNRAVGFVFRFSQGDPSTFSSIMDEHTRAHAGLDLLPLTTDVGPRWVLLVVLNDD